MCKYDTGFQSTLTHRIRVIGVVTETVALEALRCILAHFSQVLFFRFEQIAVKHPSLKQCVALDVNAFIVFNYSLPWFGASFQLLSVSLF